MSHEHSDTSGRMSHGTSSISLSLLDRVRAQDDAAWQRLVDLYSPLVFTWCRRCGMNSEDASDLMQEVFIAVATHIGDFRRDRSGDTFRGWLRTIARNKIRDHFRRREKQPPAIGGSTVQMRFQQIPDEKIDESMCSSEKEDASGLFHRGLEAIRSEFVERTWQAFWLVVVEDRSSAHVAEELGMKVGAVRNAKYKVLRRLRSEFGDLLDWQAVGG